jgi:hypothetical protein
MKGRVIVTLLMAWIIVAMFFVSAYGIGDYPLYIKAISTLNIHFIDACIGGDYIFFATADSIQVIDLQYPSNPQIISSWGCDSVRALAVSGDVICLSETNKASIWDISEITAPVFLSEISLSGATCDGIDISGQYLFAASGNFVDVIDISDPSHPFLASTIDTPGIPVRIKIKGDIALVAEITCFTVLDISDPLNAQVASVIRDPQNCLDVAYCGDYAVFTSSLDNPNVNVVNIGDPYDARIISGVYIIEDAGYIAGSGRYAYISTLYISNEAAIDLSNPYAPQIVAFSGASNGGKIVTKDDIVISMNPYMTYISTLSPPCTNIIGDANGDGHFNGLDIVYDVNFLKGTGYPVCPTYCNGDTSPVYREADANGNCQFNGIDITYAINFLKGGPPLPEICPDCPE